MKKKITQWIVSWTLNLLYFIALVFLAPVILYRVIRYQKYFQDFTTRLGFVSVKSPVDYWIHGVSVGEIKAIKPLQEEIKSKFPNSKILISATSKTGLKLAHEMYPSDSVVPFPLDFSFSVNMFLGKIKPKAVVLMELELWPNFLIMAARKRIPIVLLNGRLSEKSWRRYSWIKKFFCFFTESIKIFAMQSPNYAQRLEDLGISPERISTTGNMKFDNINVDEWKKNGEFFAKILQTKNKLVWVVGSTHSPEERYILEAFIELRNRFSDLTLVIVPRHPERAKEIATIAKSYQLSCATTTKQKLCDGKEEKDLYISDQIGELTALYSIATVAFVGGSLIPHGGQNFIEPASLGKAVVCGPHMKNFPDIKVFREEAAICQLKDREELIEVFGQLLEDANMRTSLGEKAQNLVVRSCGSTQKNFQLMESYL